LVPNINYLEGKSPFLQTLFMWICKHTDENGICYPSRERLARECGCEIRSVDRHMKVLEEDGVIVKTKRKKAKSKENASNVYQIILLDKYNKKLDLKSLPSDSYKDDEGDSNVVDPSDSNATVTISNLTKPNTTSPIGESVVKKKIGKREENRLKKESEYTFEGYMDNLIKSFYKPHKILWLYFTRKNFKFTNLAQWETAVGLAIKPAVSLSGYNSGQIERTMEYCESKWQDGWSLHAVVKNIALIANK